jgi:hypothetical protein
MGKDKTDKGRVIDGPARNKRIACLRWYPAAAANSSRMRDLSDRELPRYRSLTECKSSSRVAMLTRLIGCSRRLPPPGAIQARQRPMIREQFWRGNARLTLIVARQVPVIADLTLPRPLLTHLKSGSVGRLPPATRG